MSSWLTSRRVAWMLILLSAAFLSALLGVGLHSGWAHVDYATFAAVGVALATLLLAAMTYALAKATQIMAKEAREQLGAVQSQTFAILATMETGVRPWITASPKGPEVTVQNRELRVRVFLRNAGAGLALIQPGSATLHGDGGHPQTGRQIDGHVDKAIVPVNDDVIVDFRADCRELSAPYNDPGYWSDRTRQRRFSIQVIYADTNGNQQTCLEAYVQSNAASGTWIIRRCTYLRGATTWISEL